MKVLLKNSVNTLLNFPNVNDVQIFVKREDELHKIISGNKYRKLKYNILHAKNKNYEGLISFGGAYSNHIAALAYAGKVNNLKTIGLIRGEEISNKFTTNPTLKYARECGMNFEFITREIYKKRNTISFTMQIKNKYPNYYILPEGGTNLLGVKGCEEILTAKDKNFDYICCAVGTGGTFSGIINSSGMNQQIIGFSSISKRFLLNDISKFVNKNNWKLTDKFSFNGYAKINNELVNFMNEFYKFHNIKLDPIYTSKLFYGVVNKMKNNYFKPKSKVLVIHTGGLQGVEPMNRFLLMNKLNTINY
jgi:1-aminocyclopropane-1-carboxylate deaminase